MPNVLHPALIIGLGGSGIEIVRRFKRRFREMYADAPYVRFIGIDTAPQEQERGQVPRLDDEEFFWASRFDPRHYVGSNTIDQHEAIKKWWKGYEGLPLQFIAAGAGQRRPIGRLAFFVHYSDIREQLRRAIQSIFNSNVYFELPDRYKHGINVYIVSSTCGGTGTGMFLDAGRLVRQVATEVQPGKQTRVRALLLLPSAFIGTSQVPPSIGSALQANAFGALTELDYAMSLSVKDRAPADYPNGTRVSQNAAVFDSCYLVGNQSSSGAVYREFDTLLERAAIHMMIELASPLHERGESRLDNMMSNVNARPDYRGRPRQYSSFAADWLELPSARVHARWAKRLAERTVSRFRLPYRGEGERRVKEAFDGLLHRPAYGHLRRLTDRDGMKAYLPDVSAEEDALRDIPEGGRPPVELVQRASALGDAYRRLLDKVTAVDSGAEDSSRSLFIDVHQAAGELLSTGSFQDVRAFLDRVRLELEQWAKQATTDRTRVDAGAWMSDFSSKANEAAPPVFERFKTAKPGYVREQLALVDNAIATAREAAVAGLRLRVARVLLGPDGLPATQNRIDSLRQRVERAYATAEGAQAMISRVPEPAVPAGVDPTALNDRDIDNAFENETRLQILEQQIRAPLASLLEGNDAITTETLSARLLDISSRAVKEVAAAYLATVQVPAEEIGTRVNRLEPFALFTAQWSATSGSRETHRLDMIGAPDHMESRREQIKRAIDPMRRENFEFAFLPDPDRIMLTGQVHGYPLFALAEVAECKHAFDAGAPVERSLRFTLPEPAARRWDIMPLTSDDAMRSFSLALALRRVQSRGQQYRIFASDGTEISDLGPPNEDPASRRKEARVVFADGGLAATIAHEISMRTAKDGDEWLRNALKQWLDEEEGRAANPEYPAEFRADLDRVKNYYRSIQFS